MDFIRFDVGLTKILIIQATTEEEKAILYNFASERDEFDAVLKTDYPYKYPAIYLSKEM